MAGIKSLTRRVERMNLENIIEDVFEANKEQFAIENREQLKRGLNRKQQKLKPYISEAYAQIKNQRNPLPGKGTPDYKDTGAFYAGIEYQIDGGVIRAFLNDIKSVFLVQREQGEPITGLGGPFKHRIINTRLQPGIIREIRNSLNL